MTSYPYYCNRPNISPQSKHILGYVWMVVRVRNLKKTPQYQKVRNYPFLKLCMQVGNQLLCTSVCLCMSVCLCFCWAKTLSKFTSKSKMKFLCKNFCVKFQSKHQHRQVSRHTNTLKFYLHIYTSKTGKKGNFLLFGIAMVFQIA